MHTFSGVEPSEGLQYVGRLEILRSHTVHKGRMREW